MKYLILAVACTLAGCQDGEQDDRVRVVMREVAAMPDCDGMTLEVVERLPGKGVDGNGYSVDVEGSITCRSEWVERLEKDPRFRCDWHHHGTSCGRGEIGTGETVTVHVGDKAVNRVIWIKDWSKA